MPKSLQDVIQEDDAATCRKLLKKDPNQGFNLLQTATAGSALECVRAALEVVAHANKSESVRNAALQMAMAHIEGEWADGLDVILSYARSDDPIQEALVNFLDRPQLRQHILDNYKDRLKGWTKKVILPDVQWEDVREAYKVVPEPFQADVYSGYLNENDEVLAMEMHDLLEMDAVCLPDLLTQIALRAPDFPRTFDVLANPKVDTRKAMETLTQKIEQLTETRDRLTKAVAEKSTSAWDLLDD